MATPKLHLSKQVLKGRFPCRQPLAIFTPIVEPESTALSRSATPELSYYKQVHNLKDSLVKCHRHFSRLANPQRQRVLVMLIFCRQNKFARQNW